MLKTTPRSRLIFAVIRITLLVAASVFSASAQAKQPDMLRIKRTVKLDKLGNAQVSLNIQASTKQYTQIKSNTPNVALLLRRLGAGQHWAIMKDITGGFNDNSSTIEIGYKHINMARLTSDSKWQLRFEDDADVDLVAMMGTKAIFTSTDVNELGLVRLLVEIDAPEGSKNMKLLKGPTRIEYETSPVDATEGDIASDFEMDVKPKVMTALAKLYGNPKFTYLWTARSTFTNSGDRTIRDYRVRFRVSEYSSWSSWKRVKRVLPKQQIVDVFFPVFDLDKMAKLSGTRPVTLQVEYQYRDADGKMVEESDSRRTEVLSRNEVLFSSFSDGDAIGFYDKFNLTPAVLASMVSTNDPIMQQVAGGVSKMAGGGAASMSDEAALKYMQALYQFMSNNKIAYHTPPAYLSDGCFGQHVKYGRDVLRNRAGTCVDLAIFYASACEAVGLQPTLILIPGHCYPGVVLPSGRPVAVESTMIGSKSFVDAFKYGCKKLSESMRGTAYIVNILEMRNLGVHSLDLSDAKSTFLKDMGYKFTAATPANSNNAGQNVIPQKLVGKWIFRGELNGNKAVAIFQIAADGSYAGYMKVSNGQTFNEESEEGRVRVRGDILQIFPKGQDAVQRKFWFKDGLLWVHFPEIHYKLGFSPIK